MTDGDQELYDQLKQNYNYVKMLLAVVVWHRGGTARIDNRDLKLNYKIDLEPYAVGPNEDPYAISNTTGVTVKVYLEEEEIGNDREQDQSTG